MNTSTPTPPIEFVLKALRGEIADKAPNHPLRPGERVLGIVENEFVPLLQSALNHIPKTKRTDEGTLRLGSNMPYTFWLFQGVMHLITAHLAFQFGNCLNEGESYALRYNPQNQTWVATAVPPPEQ